MLEWGVDGPSHVGPFRTVGQLGQGGMGQVLLSVAADGRLVAVKRVHADLAEDPGFRSRFRREVDASRRVSGAYTAPVIDADPDAPTPWLASLFLPAPSLSEALEATGPLPEETMRRLAVGLARALEEIHRADLVHRDLKPSNVLLAEDGVRVVDFGIARAADHETKLTHTGALIGSPAFMSPEQVGGATPGPAGDVFSLGVTLVTATTGRTPYAGDSPLALMYAVAHDEPDLSAVPPGLLPDLVDDLRTKPERRPEPLEATVRVRRQARAELVGGPQQESERQFRAHRLGAARQCVPRLLQRPAAPGLPLAEHPDQLHHLGRQPPMLDRRRARPAHPACGVRRAVRLWRTARSRQGDDLVQQPFQPRTLGALDFGRPAARRICDPPQQIEFLAVEAGVQ
ncbi:serine/threonine-protein kinase [Streptomyces sp. NPDC001927]